MSKPGQLVLIALRKMIASGELAAGERLMEIPTAELFGVSRMPVRMAFRTLEQEGLLVRFGGRGFQVRSVSANDIAGAVEVRGVLEGLAARLTAERGLSAEARAALELCLLQGDELFDKAFVPRTILRSITTSICAFIRLSLRAVTIRPLPMPWHAMIICRLLQ